MASQGADLTRLAPPRSSATGVLRSSPGVKAIQDMERMGMFEDAHRRAGEVGWIGLAVLRGCVGGSASAAAALLFVEEWLLSPRLRCR